MTWKAKAALGALLLLTPALPALALQAGAPSTAAPPPGPGLDLINQRCITCHPVSMIFSQHKTPDDWAATVQTMADRGAEVSPEETQVIAQYLAKVLPASSAGGSGASGGAGH